MTRPTRDEYFLAMARLVATRGTCPRRQVGCVLVDAAGIVLATGYNGPPRGLPHCVDHPCPGAGQVTGVALDQCWATHDAANALMFCADVSRVHTCYATTEPCPSCAKLLLNSGCQRVLFADPYPGRGRELFELSGRLWERAP